MIWAVLPVKAPENAKQRLNGRLSAAAREHLARAMFEEVLFMLGRAKGIDRLAVATSDRQIMDQTRASGALVLEEKAQHSHSRSAAWAARQAAEMGARKVLLLPIDIPLVQPSEIELLARSELAIVPSEDGTGTNALVLTPPDAIAPRFGPGSFQAHTDQARAQGLQMQVLRPPGITFDLDTPEDLDELLRRAPDSRVARLVVERCGSKS